MKQSQGCVTEQSEISRELSMAGNVTDNLCDLIDKVYIRLQPVRREIPQIPSPCTGMDKMSLESALGRDISSMSDRLAGKCDVLREILDTLAL